MKRYFPLIILILFLDSCIRKEKFKYNGLPDILYDEIPSLTNDMFLNLQIDSISLPKGYKKIIQTIANDTINILEFDNQKRLLFKQYRQYCSEFMRDKYITMIEAHIYKDNKVVKTISLHSNIGYAVYKYDYKDCNIVSVSKYEKGSSNNNNPYWFIKHINDMDSLLAFIEDKKIDEKQNLEFKIKRKYNDYTVEEYYKNRTMKDYYLRNIFVFDPDTRLLMYSNYPKKIIGYSGLKIKSRVQEGSYDNEFTISKYSKIRDTDFIQEYSYGKLCCIEKIFKNNTSYFKYYREFDTTNFVEHSYQLDKYGFPKQVRIFETFGADSIINLTTKYLK